jgi:hypothetical protein
MNNTFDPNGYHSKTAVLKALELARINGDRMLKGEIATPHRKRLKKAFKKPNE